LDIEELAPSRIVARSDDVVDNEHFPFSFIAARQFARIFTLCSSSQSWRICFMT
jgi:hypothetical protein